MQLPESLSVGLSRVAQLARHAAESQMEVEISVGQHVAVAMLIGPGPNNLTGEDPGSLGRHRIARVSGHDESQLGSEPSQNRVWKSKFEAAC